MAKIHKTSYAILGMLFDAPHSGYEILSHIHKSTAHFWQESDASIYPTLRRLEMEGKVIAKEATGGGGKARTIFTITDVGRKDFLH